MTRSLTLAVVLLAAACTQAQTPSQSPFDDKFNHYWGDQKAELAGYDLRITRYGQPRQGVAVTIFVTEPFSNSARVKADPGKHPPADEFPVLKLNLMEDFPTGIYDYNVMTSVFVAMRDVNGRPAGTPTKISFSSQEWCGQVYHHLLFDSGRVRNQLHSYFDGEADQDTRLNAPADASSEDALPFWARGLGAPFLSAGETREVPLLRSLKTARLAHREVESLPTKLTRREGTESVTVPAGTFPAEVRQAVNADGTWTFWVEQAHPNRLLKWTHTSGLEAQLLGVERLTYWQMNGEGKQEALQKLGLQPRGPRMP